MKRPAASGSFVTPGIFSENRRTYLLYSIAGESGLAIEELGSQ
jgi:hypothetical protein